MKHILNVGCFGAMRPMKNHLLQALAAIRFANEMGMQLRFHVNASRIETGGQPVMKNLLQLFESQTHHHLVQHHWMEPEEFLSLLNSTIDIGMQVSLTETFNVVTADYVTAGVPIVVSREVKWASSWNKAEDDSIEDIVRIMERVYRNPFLVWWNQVLLRKHSKRAQKMWFNFIHRQGR